MHEFIYILGIIVTIIIGILGVLVIFALLDLFTGIFVFFRKNLKNKK